MLRKCKTTVKLAVEALEDRCLLATGFLDPTFASDGMVSTNVGLADSSDRAWDVAAYSGATPGADGKIVTVGNAAVPLPEMLADLAA